ncbi:PAS domain-containing sensor histidine kinase [Marinobacterium sediminicola]|uniref:histidine kinase n=1 Tax=Marinobacterium sediminicola TaxID=518898 RepID=A0ABY1RW33_9GAMM|nr:PAS domain S-box protein [Marinobacterium sediminicola]ULG70458.1 PAS domain S-box protein [Marinobacterium sediminicola]SMR69283.1 two-component system, LuxR family, sensor kinase FixL [Marinobacterium sediminicola]
MQPLEQELKRCLQEADRYRLLAEQSTDMISRHTPTPEWTFIDVNPAIERVLGYKAEDIIGTPGYDLFHPDDADNLKKRAESVRYRRGMYTNVYRFQHRDGHYIWLETTSRTIRDEKGKPLEVICVSRDVTERELAQQATRRLARVVEASSDLILFCNHRTLQLTYMNETAYRTFGAERENLAVFYLNQMFPQEILHNLVEPALQHAALYGTWYGSIPLYPAGNPGRIAEIREIIAHRNRAENMQVEYYSIIARDITLKRQAEEKAKRQQLEMAHMSRLLSVGEMATELAHEVNQPLATIINYCNGTFRRLEEGQINEISQVTRAMELISTQAKRASEIIKRMRRFVRRTEFQRVSFPINETCIEVTRFLKQEAIDHDIRFEFDLDDSNPIIEADRLQIEQVLLNLIRNAIEAYSDCPMRPRPVTIRTRIEGRRLQVSVSDQGHGISDEQQKTLFEPFSTTKENGLGMGLSISHTIIESHSGRLWVESDGKSGTSFHFQLPLKGQA